MLCHAPRSPTVFAAQGRLCHATPDVVRPCVLFKGGDVMPSLTLQFVRAVQRQLCHATPDVADRVCGPRVVMSSCHV